MAKRKRVHLVCNAHIDPVWLWPWQDGLTETLATFRIATEFLDQYPDLVFNHNEALLYRWVEAYDPALFAAIRARVDAGRWHISGGSYLQPDVNNTSGESHIRQFLYGQRFFADRFGTRPTTAYNFDPFGHAEGYPQILAGCGIESYIFCRPNYGTFDLPVGAFRWRDRSGAEVTARRSDDHYTTHGEIYAKLERWLPHFDGEQEPMILWGLGNHGGGASHVELREIARFAADHPEYDLVHSTPEAFFAAVRGAGADLPEVRGEIQNSFPGCYTSMSRVKRGHRRAESLMATAERMAAVCWWAGGEAYPHQLLDDSWRDILFTEFHDILPGSMIPSGEQDSLQLLGHVHEVLQRSVVRSLVQLASGAAPAPDGTVSTFAFNPHSFAVETDLKLEMMISHSPQPRDSTALTLTIDGEAVPLQREKEEANVTRDWKVRVVAPVRMAPLSLLRLDLTPRPRDPDPASSAATAATVATAATAATAATTANAETAGAAAEGEAAPEREPDRLLQPRTLQQPLRFVSRHWEVVIDPSTGLLASFGPVGGDHYTAPEGLLPVVFADTDHSWTSGDPRLTTYETMQKGAEQQQFVGPGWAEPLGQFRLATAEELEALSPSPALKWRTSEAGSEADRAGSKGGGAGSEAGDGVATYGPVRVIEDGPVRTVVEAVFVYGRSALVRHYLLSRRERLLRWRERVFWNERDCMLKLALPLRLAVQNTAAEALYSVAERPAPNDADGRHRDLTNQRWMAANDADGRFVAVVSGASSAYSVAGDRIYLNLLRSPAYSSFNLTPGGETEGRFVPRHDQGEHQMSFGLLAGDTASETVVREQAALINQPPPWLVFFPAGDGKARDASFAEVSPASVQIVAMKKAEPAAGQVSVGASASGGGGSEADAGDGSADLIVRLLETAGHATDVQLSLLGQALPSTIAIGAYGLKTLRIRRTAAGLTCSEVTLLEEPV